jgi:hypothetical protein
MHEKWRIRTGLDDSLDPTVSKLDEVWIIIQKDVCFVLELFTALA